MQTASGYQTIKLNYINFRTRASKDGGGGMCGAGYLFSEIRGFGQRHHVPYAPLTLISKS